MSKYVVQVHHILYGLPNEPQAPDDDNTCHYMHATAGVFRRLVESAGLDIESPSEYGYGLGGSIHLISDWDGICYGDYPLAWVEIGPRGGIKIVPA